MSSDGDSRGAYLRPCDDCGVLLHEGENYEYGHGSYCEYCSAGREEPPLNAHDRGDDGAGAPHEFLTGRDVARIERDPVLDVRDVLAHGRDTDE